jgi:glycosyltransferase involved in cell wall biosynthesis
MKIYFYTKSFPPDRQLLQSEGTRKALHGLASGLAECGADVTILCEGEDDGLFAMPEGYSIRCFETAKANQSFSIPKGLKQFIRQKLDSSNIVVLSGIFQPSIYAMASHLRKCSIPYVMMPHDPYNPAIFRKNSHLKWLYWHLLERQALLRAKAVQVLDARHATFLRSLKVNTPIIEVSNGFCPDDVYSEDTLSWNTGDAPQLFFLGRIDAHNKGLDLLLDAFAQISKVNDAKLTLQGVDKGDRQSLEKRVAALSVGDRTRFLNPDYTVSTPLLIGNYDVFCLPSRFEGFGLSALEAMLAGRVLLVSEVAGIAPHVEASGCGVIVAPTVAAIRQGLIELLERRSEWKAMGLRGRHYALEHLRWGKIAANALENYKQLVL